MQRRRVRSVSRSGRRTRPGSPTPAQAPDVSSLTDQQLLAELIARGVAPPVQPVVNPAPLVPLQPAPPVAVFPGKSPKFPDPEPYSGDPGSLDSFVLRMKLFLEAYGYDLGSAQCVAVSSMYLRGKAQEWFTNQHHLADLGQATPLQDWSAFISALTDAFRPVELERKFYGDLFALKQGKTEIRQYIALFNSIRAKTPVPLPENTLCYLFSQGLRVEWQQIFAVQRPRTLSEHFRLAVSLADLTGSVLPTGGKGSVNQSPPSGPKEAGAPKDTLVCDHCKKTGHDKDHCWKLHPDLQSLYVKKGKKN